MMTQLQKLTLTSGRGLLTGGPIRLTQKISSHFLRGGKKVEGQQVWEKLQIFETLCHKNVLTIGYV